MLLPERRGRDLIEVMEDAPNRRQAQPNQLSLALLCRCRQPRPGRAVPATPPAPYAIHQTSCGQALGVPSHGPQVQSNFHAIRAWLDPIFCRLVSRMVIPTHPSPPSAPVCQYIQGRSSYSRREPISLLSFLPHPRHQQHHIRHQLH